MTNDEEMYASRRRVVWHWVDGAEKIGIDPQTARYWWLRGEQSPQLADCRFVAEWMLAHGYHPDRRRSKAQFPVDLLALAEAEAILDPSGA